MVKAKKNNFSILRKKTEKLDESFNRCKASFTMLLSKSLREVVIAW